MMYQQYFRNYFYRQLDFRGHTGLLGIGKFLPIMKVKWERVTNGSLFPILTSNITLFHTFEIAFRIEHSH